PANAAYQGAFTVASSTNSTATPVYTTTRVRSNLSTAYTMISGTGSCTATVTWAADDNYTGATRSQTTTAEKITPTVTFSGAPASAAYQSTFTVASSTNSSASRAYASGGVRPGVTKTYPRAGATGQEASARSSPLRTPRREARGAAPRPSPGRQTTTTPARPGARRPRPRRSRRR